MSLYDVALFAADYLHKWEFPAVVQYNDDRISAAEREDYADRVVFAHDRSSGDTFAAPTGAHRGRRQAQAIESALCSIFACSPEEGARTSDHELACKIYRDAVVTGLQVWANDARSRISLSSGRFATRQERGDVEAWAGAVYELRFTMPHPVEQRTYPGEWRDTYTLQADDFAPTAVEPKIQGT